MEREYLEELRAILEKGWSEKTIHPAYKWEPENKSSGQCYVTARALYEILGWELLNSAKEHQFWNRLDGMEVDFTSDQSGGDGILPVDGFSGKPRKFKPIEGRKNINPRLKAYLKVVEEPLLQFKEKYSDVLKTATRNPTLEDARLVAKHAKYVQIDEEAIDRVAREWAKKDIELPKWDWLVDMGMSKEDRFDHFLVGGCLDFNFWNKEPDETYKTIWRGQDQWGAAGLFASLQRAEEKKGTRILDGQYLANITEKELEEMFGAEPGHPIPMLSDRVRILNAVGKKLVEEYDGRFHNILKKTGNEVKLVEFAQFLVREFPEAFDDVSKHGSGKIRFYKKAYLAAAQLCGNGLLDIADPENSVVFADYVVPAYARHEGMTRYSDELAKEVDSGKIMEPGSEKENEVRAVGGIFVCDRLKERTNFHRRKIGKPPITGFHIDAAAYLGGVGLAKSGVKLNHHRTSTTNY